MLEHEMYLRMVEVMITRSVDFHPSDCAYILKLASQTVKQILKHNPVLLSLYYSKYVTSSQKESYVRCRKFLCPTFIVRNYLHFHWLPLNITSY
jgi:hypothetical protein